MVYGVIMKTSKYYEFSVRYRRPEIKDEWVKKAVYAPEYTEIQGNGRIRHYIYIEEYDKFLRVVIDNGEVLNAFLDRGFNQKGNDMNFHYDKETDSLYIELSSQPGLDSEEVSEGVVVDYDKSGHIVGLDIENASKHFNLSSVNIKGFVPKIDIQSAS